MGTAQDCGACRMKIRDGHSIVEFIGMGTQDGRSCCEDYWDGNTRLAKLLWGLLGWRHEMGTAIVEINGIEKRDGHKTVELVEWRHELATVLWSLLGWRHEMIEAIMELIMIDTRTGHRYKFT